MSVNHHNEPWKGRLVRSLIALSLTLGAPLALALDTGDIVVTNTHGEVHFIIAGRETELQSGMVLELPATVRTGPDGSVGLMQGATAVNIGSDTVLEFPALEKRGGPIDRIIQSRGNAFYDIGKREGRKLRVETPYLVGVVKGTQFNVAAQGSASTISLFEGKLEIRAADDSDVVDITSGEVASRSLGDRGINVFRMDARPPLTQRHTDFAGRPPGTYSHHAPPRGAPGLSPARRPKWLAWKLPSTSLRRSARLNAPTASPLSMLLPRSSTRCRFVTQAPVAGTGHATQRQCFVNVVRPACLRLSTSGAGSGSVSVGGVDISTGTDLGLTAEDSQGSSSNSGPGNAGNGNGNANGQRQRQWQTTAMPMAMATAIPILATAIAAATATAIPVPGMTSTT